MCDMVVRIFGGAHFIKKFSFHECLYTLNLTRIPAELDDGVIFDYFANLGLYVLITDIQQVGNIISLDRTIWCTTLDFPAALLLMYRSAVRKIIFKGF